MLINTVFMLFLASNIRLIAEGLACSIYSYKETACQGTMFDEQMSSYHVSQSNIKQWSEYLASTPRFAGLMTTNKVKFITGVWN